jgi:predicted dinucleotide-binding enzyme
MTDYRLVYFSENRLPSSEIAQGLNSILEKSRSNNVMVGVTGALMFSVGYFVQVLEGPQAAVEATFERIQQDARHGDVQLVEFAPVAQRTFDNWSMAYAGRPEEASDEVADLAASSGFDPSRLDGDQLFERLRSRLLETA